MPIDRNRVLTGLVVVGLTIGVVGAWHGHRLRVQATHKRSRAHTDTRQALALARNIHNNVASEARAGDVVEAASTVLSHLREDAAAHGMTVAQVEITGTQQALGSSLQALKAAAQAAPAVGLRRVQVHITGAWYTLADLRAFLANAGRGPVRIAGLDIGKDSYRLRLRIYGR